MLANALEPFVKRGPQASAKECKGVISVLFYEIMSPLLQKFLHTLTIKSYIWCLVSKFCPLARVMFRCSCWCLLNAVCKIKKKSEISVLPRDNQGLLLILKTIREMFCLCSSIHRFPDVLKTQQESCALSFCNATRCSFYFFILKLEHTSLVN